MTVAASPARLSLSWLLMHIISSTCLNSQSSALLSAFRESVNKKMLRSQKFSCQPCDSLRNSDVSFLERPTFLRRPINQVVLEEEAVDFRCQVQGDPQPTVRWKKDDADLPRGR